MIADQDIWREANLLIGQCGEQADLQACRLADLMLDRCHHVGQVAGAAIR